MSDKILVDLLVPQPGNRNPSSPRFLRDTKQMSGASCCPSFELGTHSNRIHTSFFSILFVLFCFRRTFLAKQCVAQPNTRMQQKPYYVIVNSNGQNAPVSKARIINKCWSRKRKRPLLQYRYRRRAVLQISNELQCIQSHNVPFKL
jgi:hypothetical protein